MRRPSERRPSKCARRAARKTFRANALEFAGLAILCIACPIASFMVGQMFGHYMWPQDTNEQMTCPAPNSCGASGHCLQIITDGERPWATARQPDSSPAPITKVTARKPAAAACNVDPQDLLGLSPAQLLMARVLPSHFVLPLRCRSWCCAFWYSSTLTLFYRSTSTQKLHPHARRPPVLQCGQQPRRRRGGPPPGLRQRVRRVRRPGLGDQLRREEAAVLR